MGWEFSNGDKWPEPKDQHDRSERFSERFAVWYPTRPMLGAAMGLVVYLGVQYGSLLATKGHA